MPQITISPALYNEFQNFANATGVGLEKATHDALDQWMEIMGLAILNTLDQKKAEAVDKSQKGKRGRKRARVIAFPQSQAV